MCGKIFNVGHYMPTVQPNYIVPAMLIGTINFYHFILFSLTLTMPGGSQGQRKVKLTGFIFSHTIHLIRMKFDIVIKQLKLNILRLLLSKI